jgi:hypothetical protein
VRRKGKAPPKSSGSLGHEVEPERFWEDVEQNLRSGRVRLVFVSDLVPAELRRVIEFLNERISPTEVVGVEIKQYVGQDNLTTLAPRVVGQTEQARAQKIGGNKSPSVEVDWDYYQAWLRPDEIAFVRAMCERIERAVKDRDLAWTPRLRSGCIGFQRPGPYNCTESTSTGSVLSTSGSSCPCHRRSCGG